MSTFPVGAALDLLGFIVEAVNKEFCAVAGFIPFV